MAVAVLVVQAVLTVRALSAARGAASALAGDLSSGNLQQARVDTAALQKQAREAKSDTVGPLWWMGAHVPFVGKDVAAIRDTSDALYVVSTGTMPVLLNLIGQVQHGTLRPDHGRISPAAIAALAPAVSSAADALRSPADAIARIDPSGLIGPLRTAMRKVQSDVRETTTTIDALSHAFSVLPTMLGGSGPRNYLLLVQNPAEIRAAGGLPGTWVILRADNGRLSVTHASTSDDFAPRTAPIQVTSDEANLFGTDWGMNGLDATESPDFPRDAQMAAALAAQQGTPVSAVFSIDPIALSYVLAGTGPVQVTPRVTVTASNAVSILVNKVYLTMSQDQQGAFYAFVAHQIFDALVTGQGDQLTAIRGLVEGVSQHRVFAWSADPMLAKVLDVPSLAGTFPTSTGSAPQVGVYLNDAVADKQEYYLRQQVSARATSCRDGVQTIELKAQFKSLVPLNGGQLPPIVVGTGEYAPKGHMLMTLYVAGPWRGAVDSVAVNGTPVTVTANQLDGRQMAMVPLELAPGQSITVTATMQSRAGQTGSGQLTWTPGMTAGTDPVTFAGAC